MMQPHDPLHPAAVSRTSPVSRRAFSRVLGASAFGMTLASCAPPGQDDTAQDRQEPMNATPPMPAQTAESQAALTPGEVLDMLREGNRRFVEGTPARRDLAQQVAATSGGQYPFAVVLGCIDSRVPVETVFDQGIGDVFAARVAGNVVGGDVLGSMEYACAVAGSKAVVVLGHTSCGAVKGAIDRVELGNVTGLVGKIEPAIQAVQGERSSSDSAYVDRVVEANVGVVMDEIREQSAVLAGLEEDGDIVIAGAVYDVKTGAVRWL